ncbi:MAG: hypothetical protein FWE32_09070 [Oscillospiraceae bacterium]|nr:hypothetical protein [Oscillospiraceae bacterium]
MFKHAQSNVKLPVAGKGMQCMTVSGFAPISIRGASAFAPSNQNRLTNQLGAHAQIISSFSGVSASRAALAQNIQNQQGFEPRLMGTEEGMELLVSADDTLSRVELILIRMQELAERAQNSNLSPSERDELMEELLTLMEELNELSDDSGGLLDGSFDGILDMAGLLALGITGITSDGRIEGSARLHISNENGRLTMTLRINGETVTGQVARGTTETAFTLRSGQKITIAHDGSLRSGVAARIGFRQGNREADMSRAVSAASSPSGFWINAISGRLVRGPDLFDVSSVGLGLHGLRVGSAADAKEASAMINTALTRVTRLRASIADIRESVLGTSSSVSKTTAPAVHARESVSESAFARPAHLVRAQTNFLMSAAALRLLK